MEVSTRFETTPSGKSTFVTHLIQKYRKKQNRILRYYYFTSGNDINYVSRLSRKEFLQSLIEQIHGEYNDVPFDRSQRYDYSPEKLSTLLTDLGNYLKDRGKYLLLIVDGIDHLVRNNPQASEEVLNLFPRQLPDGIICLVGCQGLQYLPDFIRRECECEKIFRIPPFTLPLCQ